MELECPEDLTSPNIVFQVERTVRAVPEGRNAQGILTRARSRTWLQYSKGEEKNEAEILEMEGHLHQTSDGLMGLVLAGIWGQGFF